MEIRIHMAEVYGDFGFRLLRVGESSRIAPAEAVIRLC